jgi:hypothetical protein
MATLESRLRVDRDQPVGVPAAEFAGSLGVQGGHQHTAATDTAADTPHSVRSQR